MIPSTLRRNDLHVSWFASLGRYFPTMDPLEDIFRNSGNAFSCAWPVLPFFGTFLWLLLQPKAVLAAGIPAMQSQLAVCRRRIELGKAPHPRFHGVFLLLWVVLSKVFNKWEDLARVMKPATVRKWHMTALRIFWGSKSKPIRPKVTAKMQALIRRLSAENPFWGAERIRQQLEFLGYQPPREDTASSWSALVLRMRVRDSTHIWMRLLRIEPQTSAGRRIPCKRVHIFLQDAFLL